MHCTCPLFGVTADKYERRGISRLYVGAATGAGRTAVASRSRARGGGDAHLKKNPGAFEDTGARSRLTILSLCPPHSSGAIDGAMINAGAAWPFVCTNTAPKWKVGPPCQQPPQPCVTAQDASGSLSVSDPKRTLRKDLLTHASGRRSRRSTRRPKALLPPRQTPLGEPVHIVHIQDGGPVHIQDGGHMLS